MGQKGIEENGGTFSWNGETFSLRGDFFLKDGGTFSWRRGDFFLQGRSTHARVFWGEAVEDLKD